MKNFSRVVESTQDILQESLWLNSNITAKGQTFYWETWVKHGIHKLGHIVDSQGFFYITHGLIQKLWH